MTVRETISGGGGGAGVQAGWHDCINAAGGERSHPDRTEAHRRSVGSRPGTVDTVAAVPGTLYITGDPDADGLLNHDGTARLIGIASTYWNHRKKKKKKRLNGRRVS